MADKFLIRVNGVARQATEADAAIIKGMLKRGDMQQDIAAYFGTNGGRIAETNKGYRFPDVTPAPRHLLPEAGPPLAHAAAVNVQITGVAQEFWRGLQRMETKIDQLQVQLAGFGRRVGLIENPRAPRITSRHPLAG
jgi:hypothetical protein